MPATYEIYTDGSCLLNPGPGGWGALVIPAEGAAARISGGERSTTNNRMEITAAAEAIESIPPGSSAVVHSDSEYVVKTMTKGWKRNANKDLWERLERAAASRNVEFRWVRGHAGHEGNETADRLAVAAMKDVERGAIPSGSRRAETAPAAPSSVRGASQSAGSAPPASASVRPPGGAPPAPGSVAPASASARPPGGAPDSSSLPRRRESGGSSANAAPAASAPPPEASAPGLTHLDAQGSARMVDVGGKPHTARTAKAVGEIRMRPETLALILDGQIPKGDVFTVARVAGINAAKRAWEMIPLAHQIPLSSVAVDFDADREAGRVAIAAEARTTAQTGVEMEALAAVAAAALTIYDMCKAVDRAMAVGGIRLVRKTGGARGDYDGESAL